MKTRFFKYSASARFSGPAAFLPVAALLFAAFVPRPVNAAPLAGGHEGMLAAYSDLNAAIGEIIEANQTFSTNREVYHRASQRAINALEGVHGTYYVAGAGNPGDAVGAIGHVDHLLHRATGTPVWEAPLDGAEANMRTSIAYLLDAAHAHSLIRFLHASSRALGYLEVARGRPTEVGVLGGMEGVLTNTVLGVPDGATTEDGCTAPTSAPSYGVHGGYLAWITVPTTKAGVYRLAANPGGASVIVRSGMVELPSAAAVLVAKECASHASNAVPAGQKHASVSQDPPAAPRAAAGDPPPALYTEAQAEAGKAVFASSCVSCHGANLQGTAAPAVAGNDFLNSAHKNHWTVQIMRYIIFTEMPYSAPRSLSSKQYTDVLSYLLASSCYPAGKTPLPPTAGPEETKLVLGIVPGSHPQKNKYGVCPVK